MWRGRDGNLSTRLNLKKVIFNADDFGLTPNVNRGIIEAHTEGVVTSTTLMVNMPAADNAVQLAQMTPTLVVGLHLMLTDGKPILSPGIVPSLVSDDGYFFKRRRFECRILLGKVNADEIEKEFQAQVTRYLDYDLPLTHLDSHQHVHICPCVWRIALKLAEEYKVPLRHPEEQILFDRNLASLISWRFFRKAILRIMCQWNRTALERSEVKSNDYFFSVFGIFPKPPSIDLHAFELILRRIRNGVTEIMCHPGYVDDALLSISDLTGQREQELEALKAPSLKELIRELNIELGTYRDVR